MLPDDFHFVNTNFLFLRFRRDFFEEKRPPPGAAQPALLFVRAGDRYRGGVLVLQRQHGLPGVPAVLCPGGAGALPPDPGKGGASKTLLEMSAVYADSAAALRLRIAELRAAMGALSDPEELRALRARIAALDPLLREARALAELTAHYYDRSYRKHEKYTL